MKIVDLSATIAPDTDPAIPPLLRTEIEYTDLQQGAAQTRAMFGVPPELLRAGEGWTVETFLRFGTHNSTLLDE